MGCRAAEVCMHGPYATCLRWVAVLPRCRFHTRPHGADCMIMQELHHLLEQPTTVEDSDWSLSETFHVLKELCVDRFKKGQSTDKRLYWCAPCRMILVVPLVCSCNARRHKASSYPVPFRSEPWTQHLESSFNPMPCRRLPFSCPLLEQSGLQPFIVHACSCPGIFTVWGQHVHHARSQTCASY